MSLRSSSSKSTKLPATAFVPVRCPPQAAIDAGKTLDFRSVVGRSQKAPFASRGAVQWSCPTADLFTLRRAQRVDGGFQNIRNAHLGTMMDLKRKLVFRISTPAGDRAFIAGYHFQDSSVLAPSDTGSFFFACDAPGEVTYLSCDVGSHCSSGQKVEIRVSDEQYVVDPVSGETLVHSTSLKQVMKLLGAPEMERGYATEEQAEHSLEATWCLEDHCPDAAFDWDPESTDASCSASIHWPYEGVDA